MSMITTIAEARQAIEYLRRALAHAGDVVTELKKVRDQALIVRLAIRAA